MSTNSTNNQIPESMKWGTILRTIKEGDKVNLTNGTIAEFVRIKQKYFIGRIDEHYFDIPISMFVDKVTREQEEIEENAVPLLVMGEMFYINDEGKAVLYIYDSMIGKQILCSNPISGNRELIDKKKFCTKI